MTNAPENTTAAPVVALPEIVIGEPQPLAMTPEIIAALTLAAHRDVAQLLVWDLNDEIRRRSRAMAKRGVYVLAGPNGAEEVAAADRAFDRSVTRSFAFDTVLSHLVHVSLRAAGFGPQATDGDMRNAAFAIIKRELGWEG
ncbi:hypothetical protein ACIBG8_54610 [Nonomuraea sp. NPDC050556]|uniref:hypothetical protein n=1 Tax=Nonomuraea sp. NPDC050556 TaxID=3364369 RepID=UPI0037944B6A